MDGEGVVSKVKAFLPVPSHLCSDPRWKMKEWKKSLLLITIRRSESGEEGEGRSELDEREEKWEERTVE